MSAADAQVLSTPPAMPAMVCVPLATGRTAFMSLCPDGDTPMPALPSPLVVGLAADLLRHGWIHQARMRLPPVVWDGQLFRGFTLARETTVVLPSETDAPAPRAWRLEVLVDAPLGSRVDWTATIDALSRFAVDAGPAPLPAAETAAPTS